MLSTRDLVLPPIVPINSSRLLFWGGRSQRDARPPRGCQVLRPSISRRCSTAAHARCSCPSNKSPLRTSRISAVARPFRRMEIMAHAGCRMHPVGDQLAIVDRFDEFFKGRDRRVPGQLHRGRNGIYEQVERRPGGNPPPAHPGTTGSCRSVRGGSPRRRTPTAHVSSSVTAARWRCTAGILITRARYTAYSALR